MIQSRLFSQFPELIHGFSTVEDGPMAAIKVTDETSANRKQFCVTLGISPDQLVIPHQTHGTVVEQVDERHTAKHHNHRSAFVSVDALTTSTLNIYLAVFTADCIPLFCYDPTQHRVATVHLGWRGLSSDLLNKVLHSFTNPAELIIWVGPHITADHYQLLPETESYHQKLAAFPPSTMQHRNNKTFLDLTRVVMGQLTDMGVPTSQIEIAEDCTACYPDRYYSYHLAKGNQPGQMMGILGLHNDES